MQENRSFDHHFGTLRGVRGFADRFPIPVPDSPGITRKTAWYQPGNPATGPAVVAPFHLDTARAMSWQIYQNMADNYTDNPVAGFRSFRDAYARLSGSSDALRERGLATRDLDLLEQDVING